MSKRFYREQVAKAHFLLTMYINDALAQEECQGAYQAIQIMKNCVEDAYSQILGGEGFNLDIVFPEEEDEDN
jgi:hypothetical protein